MVRDPSLALNVKSHEAYAFERGCGYPPAEACRRAGGDPRNGSATKWEEKPSVQARIAWWRRQGQTEEMLFARRERLRERLELAAFHDILDDCAEIDEKTGKPVIDWRKVKGSGLGKIVSEFVFDKDTGNLVRFKREDAENAIAQLRDMHGFKAPTKTALTDPTGQKDSLAGLAQILQQIDGTTRGLPAAERQQEQV